MPTDAEINAQIKERFHEISDRIGHPLTTSDPEYWEFCDWSRGLWEEKIKQRTRETEAAPQGERLCCDCGAPLVKKPGRGRWPVRCADCKGATGEAS